MIPIYKHICSVLPSFFFHVCLNYVFVAGEKSNGERSDSPCTGKGTSGSTRMLTRLRNPDSKLSQMKSQQVAAAAHEANKLFKEGREVCTHFENFQNIKLYW